MLATETGVASVARRGTLIFSEYWYLIAVAIATLVVVDPLGSGLAANKLLKHLALMISVPSLLLTMTARKLRSPLRRTGHMAQVVRAAWPLLALAALILAGSVYARLVGGIQNTFLNVGLYMLVTFIAALMVEQSDAPEALLRNYFRILLVAAVVMSAYLIVNYRVRQVYHEQIFLVIPMAALLFVPSERTIARWLGYAFFLSMAWFSQKYTSYLIGAVTVIYLAVAVGFPRLDSRSALYRTTVFYWACILGLLIATTLVALALLEPADLPSGNVEYRWHTYAEAWDRFMASPFVGTVFATEAVEKFTLYTIGIAGNELPTHSDILDLLARGGVVAIALWIFGLARVTKIAAGNVLGQQFLGHPLAPHAHTLALMSLAGVLTYAFNPILLQPSMAFLVWSNVGLLLGLSLRAREGRLAEPTRARSEERHRGSRRTIAA